MNDCEMTGGCIFFNDRMANMPAMTDIYKQRYCKGSPATCARFVLAKTLGRENVPANLYPNDMERAQSLMA